MYKEEPDVLLIEAKMRQIYECDMEEFGTLNRYLVAARKRSPS